MVARPTARSPGFRSYVKQSGEFSVEFACSPQVCEGTQISTVLKYTYEDTYT